MQLIFKGRVFATPSAVTILKNGVEIFSGQVGAGQPLDTEITLYTNEIPLPCPAENLALSISVTSGVITFGDVQLYVNDWTPPVYLYPTSLEGTDLRTDILVNGSLPEWPATPVDPMPGGTESNPDWQGWFFELAAGETATFNVAQPLVSPQP
jgi:hypothetical protein